VNEPLTDRPQRGSGLPRPVPAPVADPPNAFLDALRKHPIVLDAGLGTRLIASGLDLGHDDPAFWNVTHAADVLAIHRRDAVAGAQALFTNTFGANRSWLARYGRESEVESINRRAVELARLAAGPGRFVIGDIGPTAAAQPSAAYEQARILLESGVDALILETYLAGTAVSALRELGAFAAASVPIIVSLREWPADRVEFEDTTWRLLDLGAAVLGVNCQPDISASVAFAGRMNELTRCPQLVKPGVDPRCAAGSEPASFAAAVPSLLAANVRMVGGCCGTTELHIRALAEACARQSQAASQLVGGHLL
jgi:5-methyltetrahydrofolate--homocysteine methyltransferase